jgi:hypothetical protein
MSYSSLTLQEWNAIPKTRDMVIYNASEHTALNDDWVPFSIGIQWSYIHFADAGDKLENGSHTELVLSAFRTHTDRRRRPHGINRDSIKQNLDINGIPTIELHENEYFRTLGNYKFVVSPEGNGIDCHRHYEALLAGCIPIIEAHDGICEKYRGAPILWTRDYSEITPAYLSEKYDEMKSAVYDFSKLVFSSYDDQTKEEIRNNGNYWSQRLAGKRWY